MGVGGQYQRPGRFTPGKNPVPIVQEAGWAPGPVWTGAENLASTGIRSPDRPARSESLYRLSYTGPEKLYTKEKKEGKNGTHSSHLHVRRVKTLYKGYFTETFNNVIKSCTHVTHRVTLRPSIIFI
jgi:hypothetical protein